MPETYTINGQKYEVEVKGDRNAVNQTLVINGQEISLTSGPILDNSGKSGLGMHLDITASGKYAKLGNNPADFSYKGLGKEEIYAVMKERVERGQATSAERMAVYQQQYNNMAKAEALAQGKAEYEADLLKLTKAQIQGKAPLPDIKARFPWAYASNMSVTKDKVAQYWNADAKFRATCREKLTEVEKMPWFDTMYREGNTIRIKDQLAKNSDTRDALSNQRKVAAAKGKVSSAQELDTGTERLLAAAEKKASTKTQKAVRSTGRPNPSVDYERA